MSKDNTKVKRLLARGIALIEALEANKKLYKELDETIESLAQMGFQSAKYKNELLVLVDNYAEKNVVYKAVGIRRYELKVAKLGAHE